MNVLAFLLSATIIAQADGTPAPQAYKDAKQVVADNNQFAIDLYRQLSKGEGNRFFSPFSISSALAMTYGGARGVTAKEMASTLHFTLSEERFHPAFGLLVRQINGMEEKRSYKLVTANRLWGQKDYGFLPEFLKVTGTNYQAGLEELDFMGDVENARKTINAWVEKQTQDKIKDLLKPGILTPEIRLVLTNAIYFKGAWMDPFPERLTARKDFHGSAGKKQVDMMFAHKDLMLAETKNAQLVSIPYERGDLSMLVLLPRARDGLAAVEGSLTSCRDLDEALSRMKRHSVKLHLPRFKMTTEASLKDTLSRMGMKRAFTREADFSGIATRDKLAIDNVIHKAFVDVNEAGTEAAAATAVTIKATSAPAPSPPAEFNADHPFLFWIQDRRTGSILFMGRVTNVE